MLCLRSALSAWPSGGPPLAGDAWVHPELAALRDYWLSKCGARRMPARSAIDPLEMKRWLGHLVLHEVIDGGRDFLCKVYGSVLAEMLHHDRSEEHTSELQSLMRISYAVFCLKKKKKHYTVASASLNTY